MDLDFTKLTENFDPEMRAEILQQLEKIKKQSGVSFENDYKKDLENIEDVLGMSFSEMETEMNNLLRERKINVELIDESAVFPKYAYPSDSGFDLHSTQDLEIGPFGRILVPTGLKVSFDEGYEIQVRPKSGLALKQGLTVLNTPGTVDSGYDGEVKVILYNSTHDTVYIEKRQKIAQACVCPVANGRWVNPIEVSEISGKDRGDKGFGSTGI
jgi:dUTP pyrophosphatase